MCYRDRFSYTVSVPLEVYILNLYLYCSMRNILYCIGAWVMPYQIFFTVCITLVLRCMRHSMLHLHLYRTVRKNLPFPGVLLCDHIPLQLRWDLITNDSEVNWRLNAGCYGLAQNSWAYLLVLHYSFAAFTEVLLVPLPSSRKL